MCRFRDYDNYCQDRKEDGVLCNIVKSFLLISMKAIRFHRLKLERKKDFQQSAIFDISLLMDQ